MRVLFAHDNVFVRRAGSDYYAIGDFSYETWKRDYLSVFDSIKVVARVRDQRDEESVGQLNRSDGPGVTFSPVPSLSGPVAQFSKRPEAIATLRTQLHEVDGLIARLPSEVGALAIEVAEQMGKPWVVEVVGCAFDALWHHGRFLAKLYAPYAHFRMRRLVRRSPFALYVTSEFLQRRYPCSGQTLACPIVSLPPSSESVLNERTSTINAGRQLTTIGLIGSLQARYKGIHTALRALSQVRDKMPPFEFRILGGGNPGPWQKLAKEHGLTEQTVFCGTLPSGGPVAEWIDHIDLYIQPSLTEGLPRALIEAMSRGCPAIGSSVGGIPELLPSECLHRPGDSEGLARLMVQAVHDKSWQLRQAERNFAFARSFTPNSLAPSRIGFLREFEAYALQPKRSYL